MMLRFMLRRQLDASDARLRRTDRVIALMRAAGARETRQTDKLRSSGRRGSARLAQR